jgi:hypothetical protein
MLGWTCMQMARVQAGLAAVTQDMAAADTTGSTCLQPLESSTQHCCQQPQGTTYLCKHITNQLFAYASHLTCLALSVAV